MGIFDLLSLKKRVRLFKTPAWVRKVFPRRIWCLPADGETLYLTFDDGPTKEVTAWILSTLYQYNAKATFFCVGANMKRHPDLLKQIEDQGHAIGNHTFSHTSGNRVSADEYIQDVAACKVHNGSTLFRPPHGRLPFSHAKRLFRAGYNIIMWDVLSYDFDVALPSEKLWEKIRRNVKPGSIVVFHDNVKAERHLRVLLPRTLEHFSALGYKFESICL